MQKIKRNINHTHHLTIKGIDIGPFRVRALAALPLYWMAHKRNAFNITYNATDPPLPSRYPACPLTAICNGNQVAHAKVKIQTIPRVEHTKKQKAKLKKKRNIFKEQERGRGRGRILQHLTCGMLWKMKMEMRNKSSNSNSNNSSATRSVAGEANECSKSITMQRRQDEDGGRGSCIK